MKYFKYCLYLFNCRVFKSHNREKWCVRFLPYNIKYPVEYIYAPLQAATGDHAKNRKTFCLLETDVARGTEIARVCCKKICRVFGLHLCTKYQSVYYIYLYIYFFQCSGTNSTACTQQQCHCSISGYARNTDLMIKCTI